MHSKIKLIFGIVLLIIVIGGSTLLYQTLIKNYKPQNNLVTDDNVISSEVSTESTSGGKEEEPEKMLAPDFSLVDSDGNTVKLSDFIGKPVVLNFWASWCPPCKEEMPEFDKVWKEIGEDVSFMMINATDGGRETEDTAKKFLESQEYSFPVFFDTTQEASYLYGVTSLPTTLFIDADGYLITGAVGMIDEETLRKGIAMITPIVTEETTVGE